MTYKNIFRLSFLITVVLAGCAVRPMLESPLPAGSWAGVVEQRGPGTYRMSFDTRITLDGMAGGTVSYKYQGLACGGKLVFVQTNNSAAVYREKLEYGGGCVDNGLVSIQAVAARRIIFGWQSPGITAAGDLTSTSN